MKLLAYPVEGLHCKKPFLFLGKLLTCLSPKTGYYALSNTSFQPLSDCLTNLTSHELKQAGLFIDISPCVPFVVI